MVTGLEGQDWAASGVANVSASTSSKMRGIFIGLSLKKCSTTNLQPPDCLDILLRALVPESERHCQLGGGGRPPVIVERAGRSFPGRRRYREDRLPARSSGQWRGFTGTVRCTASGSRARSGATWHMISGIL